MESMKAETLVAIWGKRIIGKDIWTPPMGRYPGGIATVLKIEPDPGAPEIVFEVRNRKWMNDDGSNIIGVFADEICQIDVGDSEE